VYLVSTGLKIPKNVLIFLFGKQWFGKTVFRILLNKGRGERGQRYKIRNCNPYRSILYFLLDIWSVLITCRFHICEFVCVRKFICNSQISIHVSFAVIHGTCCKVADDFSFLTCAFAAEVKQGNPLFSCPSFPTVNKGPFCTLFSALFFTFVLSCGWFCCFRWSRGIVLKCCLVFLGTRRLSCASRRKYMC